MAITKHQEEKQHVNVTKNAAISPLLSVYFAFSTPLCPPSNEFIDRVLSFGDLSSLLCVNNKIKSTIFRFCKKKKTRENLFLSKQW